MHTGKQKQMNASYQASLVNRHIRRFTGLNSCQEKILKYPLFWGAGERPPLISRLGGRVPRSPSEFRRPCHICIANGTIPALISISIGPREQNGTVPVPVNASVSRRREPVSRDA